MAFEGFGDTGVKRASRLAQQRAIGRVLHKGMLEQVGRMRRRALPEKQTSRNETIERRSQLRLRLTRHRIQQGMRSSRPIAAPICETSLAGPSGRVAPSATLAGLQGPPGWVTEWQRPLERCALATRFQYRLGHLLDERGMPSMRSTMSCRCSRPVTCCRRPRRSWRRCRAAPAD